MNAVDKFKNQPSIQKIKERVNVGTKFKFSLGSEDSMRSVINELNINKPTAYNVDICSHYITETYNHAVLNCTFPDALKMADITPVYKKDEKILKSNYRPVSILPCVSKIFERCMYHDIWGIHQTIFI